MISSRPKSASHFGASRRLALELAVHPVRTTGQWTPFVRHGHRFNDPSIGLFTLAQPSATVISRPSSLLDWP